jgi:hypothetical protein
MDSDGRVTDVESVKERIFRGVSKYRGTFLMFFLLVNENLINWLMVLIRVEKNAKLFVDIGSLHLGLK